MCKYRVADYHHYLLLCSLSGIRSVLFTSGSSVCICIQLAGFKVHVLPLTVTLKSPSGYICMTLPTFPKICRNKNDYKTMVSSVTLNLEMKLLTDKKKSDSPIVWIQIFFLKKKKSADYRTRFISELYYIPLNL